MSAIADFKKRREAAKRAQSQAEDSPENTKAPENEALLLLAALLGCDVDQAIEQGREQVAKNAEFASRTGLQFDRAEGKDQTAQATVTTDEQGNITSIIDHAAELEDSASNLAYTADDLGQVAAELKEATAELKKPSAVPASSRGAKAAAPKSNSKKSG